ncbi:GSCOCG00012618001-RA-CDS [Cotesia congregata]|uniref:Uncharacterized protein n=1 Tax=Cotesia congregata TaxID=51543 RepID=A0A8J2H862_COTCN|nr:GSCOCG00012618001-RA-CDS [Cotesia congregata]CAG5083016.1 Protein of unknown function [Cotesia congregata]
MKISAELWSFLAAILATLTFADKTPDLKINTLTINNTPDNPYFGNWSFEISESGDRFSLLFPIKQDYPENMMFGLAAELNGRQVLSMEMSVCDGLEAGLANQRMLDHVYPPDTVQLSCPVKAADYELRDYSFSADNSPFQLEAGELFVKLFYFEPDGEPILTITMEGLISDK